MPAVISSGPDVTRSCVDVDVDSSCRCRPRWLGGGGRYGCAANDGKEVEAHTETADLLVAGPTVIIYSTIMKILAVSL